MIKTVIFDLGGVIVPLDFARGYAALESMCSYPATQIPERIGFTDLVPRFETGQVPPEEFYQGMCEILGLNVSFEKFCGLWSSIFPPHTLIPESLLESLHRRYRLLLLSNTNAIHFPMIRENYALMRHFDHYVLSYQVKAMKPSPLIYREAIVQSGCRSEECFFTDDIPAYVEGARREGIDAVQFQSYSQIQGALRERGIEF